MMRREYDLVSRASSDGLFLQAIIAVIALAFYAYVGLTGGIVSGGGAIPDNDTSEATTPNTMLDNGNRDTANSLRDAYMNEDMLPPENFIPIQRDTETSVWL